LVLGVWRNQCKAFIVDWRTVEDVPHHLCRLWWDVASRGTGSGELQLMN